jgi:hypothetical protein
MTSNEFYKMDKLIPYKNGTPAHTYITDSDLQIHLSSVKEKSSFESTVSFKAILSKYMGEASLMPVAPLFDQLRDREAIKKAMDDAERAYASMMQIRKDLEIAYKNLFQD